MSKIFGVHAKLASTDWQSYTMNIAGTTSNPTKATTTVIDIAKWRRLGDSMQITYNYYHTNNTGAAAGSGIYLFPLPLGYTIDSSKLTPSTLGNQAVVGNAIVRNASGAVNSNGAPSAAERAFAYAVAYNTTNIALISVYQFNDSTPIFVGSAFCPLTQAAESYSFTVTVPISGWTSSDIVTATP